MKKDDSILFDGSHLKTDAFKLDKPVTICLLRKASSFEVKALDEWEDDGLLDDYTVDGK